MYVCMSQAAKRIVCMSQVGKHSINEKPHDSESGPKYNFLTENKVFCFNKSRPTFFEKMARIS